MYWYRRLCSRVDRWVGWYWSWWYGTRRHSVRCIGVVGTKGKTTTIALLTSIFEHAGMRVAALSSVTLRIGATSAPGSIRRGVPSHRYVHRFLYRARRHGCDVVLLECTSYDSIRERYDRVPWYAVIFTNITSAALERNDSFAPYQETKLRLLRSAARNGALVYLNRDDEAVGGIVADLRLYTKPEQLVLYSAEDQVWLDRLAEEPFDSFDVAFHGQSVAAARAVAIDSGIAEKVIATALRTFPGVPGRLQFICTDPFAVVIDLARTPDSLLRTYALVRGSSYRSSTGRLIAVLGASFERRDVWRYRLLGRIAATYCDELVLTSEDTYGHDAEVIAQAIRDGLSQPLEIATSKDGAATNVTILIDRHAAIIEAIQRALPGDVVVITGQGTIPWRYLTARGRVVWDEVELVRGALYDRGGVRIN